MNQIDTYQALCEKKDNLTMMEFMELTGVNEERELTRLLVMGFGQGLLQDIEDDVEAESVTERKENLELFERMLAKAGISKEAASEMIRWLNKD